MSQIAIQAALQAPAIAMTPALKTSVPNVAFTPPEKAAYQIIDFLWSDPANPESGAGYQERGTMQLALMYPLGAGEGDAKVRAEAVRTLYRRGASFTQGGVTVQVERTPTIAKGYPDGDRWRVPVSIRFYANRFG